MRVSRGGGERKREVCARVGTAGSASSTRGTRPRAEERVLSRRSAAGGERAVLLRCRDIVHAERTSPRQAIARLCERHAPWRGSRPIRARDGSPPREPARPPASALPGRGFRSPAREAPPPRGDGSFRATAAPVRQGIHRRRREPTPRPGSSSFGRTRRSPARDLAGVAHAGFPCRQGLRWKTNRNRSEVRPQRAIANGAESPRRRASCGLLADPLRGQRVGRRLSHPSRTNRAGLAGGFGHRPRRASPRRAPRETRSGERRTNSHEQIQNDRPRRVDLERNRGGHLHRVAEQERPTEPAVPERKSSPTSSSRWSPTSPSRGTAASSGCRSTRRRPAACSLKRARRGPPSTSGAKPCSAWRTT